MSQVQSLQLMTESVRCKMLRMSSNWIEVLSDGRWRGQVTEGKIK